MAKPNSEWKNWTTDEVAQLRDLYPRMATKHVAQRLGRTHQATRNMAVRLKLRKTQEMLSLIKRQAGRKSGQARSASA